MKNHELHRARFNEDMPVSLSKHAIQSKGEDEKNVIFVCIIFRQRFGIVNQLQCRLCARMS
jgi:hypothetical protein